MEKEMRLELVQMAGLNQLAEIPFALRFINGDDKALEELEDFRQWKIERSAAY